MTKPIITTEEIKELLKAAYASAIEAEKCHYEYLTLPLKERYEIMLAERNAYALEVQAMTNEKLTAIEISAEDAAFIAAARVDVPALVAEVRRLRTLVESAYMEGAMANWGGHGVPAEYLPKDWATSDARKALEVQP
jgi:hypothetical protein